MAREIETEQKKKKSKIKTLIIVILVIALLAGGGFALYKFIFDKAEKKTVVEVRELDNLKDYGYVLTDRDGGCFKKEFETLKDIVNKEEVNIEAYTSQVAKMFVIDLYTLNNKVNKYDIGGNEYFHVNKKTMFEQKVIDTLYSSLLDNTYGDRKQTLPEVSAVEVLSNTESTYKLGNKEVKAYVVTMNISYTTDIGYDKEATVVLCQEDDNVRWSVVDYQPEIKKVS